MRPTAAILALLAGMACGPAARGADLRDVENVRDKFRSIYPAAADLAIYQLDWAPTLAAAKEKAARDQRPILLVVVRNSFGDICSGHC